MNFTHNNHLTYTIGNKLFGVRETIYEKFNVAAGKIDLDYYKTSNWLNEQYRTASIISQDFGKDIALMFSGGTDSEICLRAFLHVGIKPRTVFIKFKGDYNWGDFKIAQKIAKQLDVDLEVIEIDVVDFYRSGRAYDLAGEIQCRQIAYLTVYRTILDLQMPAVMGGEMLLRRHVKPEGSKWYYCFRENEDASAMRFSLKYNIPLVNEWFSYTPEMMGYYLEHPSIHQLVSDRFNYKLASVSSKNSILKTLMPEIVDKVKTTGYERLLGFNGETYRRLNNSHTKPLTASLDGIFIDNLMIQLFGDNYVSRKT